MAACAGSALAGKPVRADTAVHHERLLREAVRRERLEHDVSELEVRLVELRQIALALASGEDPLQALGAIAARAMELVGASGGAVLFRVPCEQALEVGVTAGEYGAPVGSRIDAHDGPYGRLWDAGEPVDAIGGEPAGAKRRAGAERAWIAVPARWGDELLGAVVVEGGDLGRAAEGSDQLLTLLAALAAVVISNGRLLAAERQQRQLAQALAGAASVLSGTLYPDEVLDRILEEVQRVVPGDACNVMLVDGGTAHIVRQRGYQRFEPDDQLFGKSVAIADYPSLARMLQSGEPTVVSDTRSSGSWAAEEGQEWLLSYVGAPIRVGDVTVGFLNVDGTRPGQFVVEHGARLGAFAGHAAVAIENALLYSRLHGQNEHLEERVWRRTVEVQAEYAQL